MSALSRGQERAVVELDRIQIASEGVFEIVAPPKLSKHLLVVHISIRIGPLKYNEGGLRLHEREEFRLIVPSDFPFDCPWLKVDHDRFARFPHVVWKNQLCLYQSKEIEWDPSDGLYGFFHRLRVWLGKAAMNDMDPIDGPLEPPHHIVHSSHVPFVIKSNAPVEVGDAWIGLAELKKYSNRVELVGWNAMSGSWTTQYSPALAIILQRALPMEFPEKGKEFFRELMAIGVDRRQILINLLLASLFASKDEPMYLILGLPMRRGVDGAPKIHIAVWTAPAKIAESLRLTLPKHTDTDEIRKLRDDFLDKIYSFFEETVIDWCRVMEERAEIVQDRDKDSPLKWVSGKNILILGCGALGSWVSEIVARAKPKSICLVDNDKVNIGLLARQNYELDDFCMNKSVALASRLKKIIGHDDSVKAVVGDAHKYLTEEAKRIDSYDLVLDCTASKIFQMKLERDWSIFEGCTPPIISIVIDAKAERCLSVAVRENSTGGIWNAYILLKKRVCLGAEIDDIAKAFYSEQATDGLFQPEPGCSDPTFSGSTADIFALISTALNASVNSLITRKASTGTVFRTHSKDGMSGRLESFELPELQEIEVADFRVRFNANILREARAWVLSNKRTNSELHETGGLLWGSWDDAIGVIWLLDLSGPPADSVHESAHFLCGTEGTLDEHKKRIKTSYGCCGFVGYWHTHPSMPSRKSNEDHMSMTSLVSRIDQNLKKIVMLIFGRTGKSSTLGVYVYESQLIDQHSEIVSIGECQIPLEMEVV